jgi:lipopolysaccharide export system protein LptA
MSPRCTIYALLLLASGAAPAIGAEGDASQPIEIQADAATVDERKGISTYSGSVQITQGSMQLSAEIVRVYAPERRLERVEAEGQKVRFRQLDAEGQEVRAEAQTVDYRAAAGEITLTGEAKLWRGESIVESERIVYDIQDQVVIAGTEGGGQRVNAVIVPNQPGTDTPQQ